MDRCHAHDIFTDHRCTDLCSHNECCISRPAPDAGWGIRSWIEARVADRRFYATGDVQHAYARDGFAGIVARCDEALEAIAGGGWDLDDPIRLAWVDLRDGAYDEIAATLDTDGSLAEATERRVDEVLAGMTDEQIENMTDEEIARLADQISLQIVSGGCDDGTPSGAAATDTVIDTLARSLDPNDELDLAEAVFVLLVDVADRYARLIGGDVDCAIQGLVENLDIRAGLR